MPEDLEAAEQAEGVRIGEGDILTDAPPATTGCGWSEGRRGRLTR